MVSLRTKPRILFIITDEVSSLLLKGQLDFLNDKGFSVFVCARAEDGNSPTGFDLSASTFHIPFVRKPSPLADFRSLVRAVRIIRIVQPTIVNASTPKAGLIGMIAAWICRVPVRVLVIRGLRFETMNGLGKTVQRFLETCSGRLATHVWANSQSVLNLARTTHVVAQGKGEVLGYGSGNGLDPSRFNCERTRNECRDSLGLDPNAVIVGYVGRLTRSKGIHDLMTVIDRVAEIYPDIQVLVVGRLEEGDFVGPEIKRRIETDPRVLHIPHLEEPVVAYRAIDVLVFPSFREGLPNVVLEVQASGTPVVAYDATGTRDAMCSNAWPFLVELGNSEKLAEAVIQVLSDFKLRSDFELAGPKWVNSRFSRERLWTEIEAKYVSWCKPEPGSPR